MAAPRPRSGTPKSAATSACSPCFDAPSWCSTRDGERAGREKRQRDGWRVTWRQTCCAGQPVPPFIRGPGRIRHTHPMQYRIDSPRAATVADADVVAELLDRFNREYDTPS